jgi:hypothetical protein
MSLGWGQALLELFTKSEVAAVTEAAEGVLMELLRQCTPMESERREEHRVWLAQLRHCSDAFHPSSTVRDGFMLGQSNVGTTAAICSFFARVIVQTHRRPQEIHEWAVTQLSNEKYVETGAQGSLLAVAAIRQSLKVCTYARSS